MEKEYESNRPNSHIKFGSFEHGHAHGHHQLTSASSVVLLSMAKRKSTECLLTQQWLPSMHQSDNDIYVPDVKREQLGKRIDRICCFYHSNENEFHQRKC